MDKKCSKCKELKSVDDFHKNKATKDGLNAYCKVCFSAYIKARYHAKKELVAAEKEST